MTEGFQCRQVGSFIHHSPKPVAPVSASFLFFVDHSGDMSRQPYLLPGIRDADIDIGTDNCRDDSLFAPNLGLPVT